MKITVGGETFKSKAALLDRIRGILYDTPLGSQVAPGASVFLTLCLAQANRYYRYPEEHPISWQVRRQLMIGNHPEFVFIRADGSEENPSIKRLSMQKSINGKRPVDGARQSVVEQILGYRDLVIPSCCSRCRSTVVALEVHHDEPSFNQIWREFLARPGVVEADMSILEYRDANGVMTGYVLAPPYGAMFANFHRERANLVLLCAECHDGITYKRISS